MILETISSRDLLIDAYKFYSRGDARAHDALQIIKDRNDMTLAVRGCLNEAIKDEDPVKQNMYVQAACFGKKCHPGIAIEEFQSVCRSLRVLNICRSQDLDTSSDTAIEQLIERKQFSLALWVANWLKIDGEQKILTKWSEYMIENSYLRDEQVASRIKGTLGTNPIVSYADIANKAIEHNRITLAIKLIENESQSSKQIPLLLSLKQYDLVLAQALSTCDSNLIYMAIFKLKETMPSEIQFLELIKKHPLALRYYCNFLAVSDIQKLIMISYVEGSRDELTFYLLDDRLEAALSVSKRTKQEFVASQIETSMKLNKFQQSLKQAPPLAKQATWVGLSMSDTIINLVASGNSGKARDCQKKFHVSEEKYKVLEQIATNTLPMLTVLPIT